MSLVSAVLENPMPARTVAFGEVGLSGEVRPVSGVARRLSEAARLGFTTALVARGAETGVVPVGIRVVEVGQLVEAVQIFLLDRAGTAAL